MKLAFVGNTNNMPLVYARALRENGHDVDIYVDGRRDERLHRPENRYPEYGSYPVWIKDRAQRVPILSYSFPRVLLRGLVSELNEGGYDGVVLNGFAISLAPLLTSPVMALLAGSDLDVLCDPRAQDQSAMITQYGLLVGRLRYAVQMRFVRLQRAGLRACGAFNYFAQGIHPRGEELLAEIYRGLEPARLQVRGTDCTGLSYVPPSDRVGAAVRIFAPVRFLFRDPMPPGFTPQENKRNDIILRGFALYVHRFNKAMRLTMVKKGPDVPEAEKLCAELDISKNVNWLEEMSQIEITRRYIDADIVFDQMGQHTIGAIGFDSMLVGRPVIANGRIDVYDCVLFEKSPICHATTPEEVCAWLARLVDDPGLRARIGRRSNRYVMRHFNMDDTVQWVVDHFMRVRSGGE